jgi:hypothetical protein
MDGYTLAAQLRRTRRRYRLSATSQALYYELVAIANEEGCPDTFQCSNGELCSALSMTDKTIIAARLELIQSDLINYKSNKNKRAFAEYSFLLTGKFPVITPVKSPVITPLNPPDYNKLKEKPKPKQTVVVADCATTFDFFMSTKNKRLLVEQHKLTDEQLEWYFLVFYDSKVDLGDLNGKSLEDITKNFYYWMPKHLAAQQYQQKEKNCAKKESTPPTRGVAAALQFTDVVMRE